MQEVKLECRDVIKIYESSDGTIKVPALRGIDLFVRKGDLISIIGPSGSGKTTLVEILGLLERMSSGEILLHTDQYGTLNYSEPIPYNYETIRRNIFGFIFQFPEDNLLFRLSALENLTFVMKLNNVLTREERLKRANELLKELGILSRKHHLPSQLSGGEAQRLSVCVALANDPAIILADEPTGELDSINTFKMIDYFKRLNNELGKTFIVVTHDYRFSRATKKTYRIQSGKITSLLRKTTTTEGRAEREELVYVSEDGALQLPLDFRQEYKIGRTVKLVKDKDHFKIFPTKNDE